MDIQAFLDEIRREFPLSIKEEKDYVLICNTANHNRLLLEKDEYETIDSKACYVEYTVRFSTQHRHFSDLSNAMLYIKGILNDDIIPIEFYDKDGHDRFGGDINRNQYSRLSVLSLAKEWGYSAKYLTQFQFECHCWSGTYDLPRTPVSFLPVE